MLAPEAKLGSAPAHPLHVVIFLVDDLGYGDTHHMGAEYDTPHISSLALGGVRLNQSYAAMLCSPSRASLLSSRYAYRVGMDGEVLNFGDERCLNVTTLGKQMKRFGMHTAFIGKHDVGYSSWACTPNCNGFDYFLGYYGPAQDYYSHGPCLSSPCLSSDFHENFVQAPQYRGEYSTHLFVRKAIEWIRRTTSAHADPSTFLYFSSQAVHTPIDAPPGRWPGCAHITEPTRRTYCAMVKTLDEGIGNVTSEYKRLGIFDDSLWLFLSDNGGSPDDGGFNVPLRGGKGSVWEGGVRSQTFLHWSGLTAAVKGSVYGGMAHIVDWGVTLMAALGHAPWTPPGEPDFDGLNLWPALTSGGASPRTEMLLSMRAADGCRPAEESPCRYPGFLAYRSGRWKLIFGKPGLSGSMDCGWTLDGVSCFNGWAVPRDEGVSRAPTVIPAPLTPLSLPPLPPLSLPPFDPPRPPCPPPPPSRPPWPPWPPSPPSPPAPPSLPPSPPSPPPLPPSVYQWGGAILFDIESDPLEEHELSAEHPDIVLALTRKLAEFSAAHIDQSTFPLPEAMRASTWEPCDELPFCAAPWRGHAGSCGAHDDDSEDSVDSGPTGYAKHSEQ